MPAYPVKIGIKLEKTCRIKALRVLAHESKIASLVEVFTGQTGLGKTRWLRIGNFVLDANDKTQHMAREMKTVYLNVCYLNKFNLDLQVGLVQLMLIGDPVREPGGGASPRRSRPSRAPGRPQGAPSVAPIPEASPAEEAGGAPAAGAAPGGVDAGEVYGGERLRQLQARKDAAVRAEDFDEAKRLKRFIDLALEAGARLQQAEQRRQDCVAAEDFDGAKDAKAEVERLRAAVDAALAGRAAAPAPPPSSHGRARPRACCPHRPGLPRRRGLRARPAGPSGHSASLPPLPRPAAAASSPPGPTLRPQPPQWTTTGTSGRCRPCRGGTTPGPAGRATLGAGRGAGGGAGDGAGKPPDDERPNLANREELREAVEMFGEDVVADLHAKAWPKREAALARMAEAAQSLPQEAGAILRVCRGLLKGALKDKIAQVYVKALELARMLADGLAPQVRRAEARSAFDAVVEAMLQRMGDTNLRQREWAATNETLLHFARSKALGPGAVAPLAVGGVAAAGQQWRPVMARLSLLQRLLPEFKINVHPGLSADAIVPFAVAALGSANAEVRQGAVRTLALVASLGGKEARERVRGALRVAGKEREKHAENVERAIAEMDAAAGRGAETLEAMEAAGREVGPGAGAGASPTHARGGARRSVEGLPGAGGELAAARRVHEGASAEVIQAQLEALQSAVIAPAAAKKGPPRTKKPGPAAPPPQTVKRIAPPDSPELVGESIQIPEAPSASASASAAPRPANRRASAGGEAETKIPVPRTDSALSPERARLVQTPPGETPVRSRIPRAPSMIRTSAASDSAGASPAPAPKAPPPDADAGADADGAPAGAGPDEGAAPDAGAPAPAASEAAP
eukprot:tig00021073_g18010.t1